MAFKKYYSTVKCFQESLFQNANRLQQTPPNVISSKIVAPKIYVKERLGFNPSRDFLFGWLINTFFIIFAVVQLIELQRSQFQRQEDVRQQIKVASFIAGLQGKPVVLFVPEGVDDDSMQDVCSLMAEGK